MRDDFQARSPHRGTDSNPSASKERSYEDRQDNSYNRSRQGKHTIRIFEEEELIASKAIHQNQIKTLYYGPVLNMAANIPTGRRDSRSPPRQAFHHDHRGRDSRSRDVMYHDVNRGARQGDYDEEEGRSGGRSWSHTSRRHPRDEHDYGGMYDEGGYQDDNGYRGRYGGGMHRDDRRRHRGSDGKGSRSQSPPESYYTRSRSQSPTRDAGKPSDTVILEGLPFGISASELKECILSNSIAAEFPSIDVRVSASKGTRRAFVQFEEVDHAVAFMREHFPKLFLDLTHSTDDVPDGRFNVYIHYARNREEVDARGATSNNWLCPTCDFSNYSSRTKCKICGGPQSAPNWQQSLTGFTDAAVNVASQILVVYPLAPFVNEDMFATDIKRLELEKVETSKDNASGAPKLKSTAPGDTTGYGARPGSIHRVFLIRDVSTNESFKYGFVEFWTMDDAAAAMAKFQRARNFTVAACPVSVANIHMGVFIPEDREVAPETEYLSFSPLFNPELRVRYRDRHVYPSQKIVTLEPPNDGSSKAAMEANEAKKAKKRKADGALAAAATKKSVPMMGQMAMWQKKRDELREAAEPAPEEVSVNQIALGPSKANGSASKSGNQGPIKISLGNTKLGVTPSTVSKSALPAGEVKAPTEGVSASSEQNHTSQALDNSTRSFVDRERLMCLICMRKYKSVDEVNIHEKSRNHRTATENDELVRAALPRLAARDKRQNQAQANLDSNEQAGSQYRDRAKERRAVYNQPTKPTVPPSNTAKGDKPPPKKEEVAAAEPVQSKGAGMLAKMGWTTGAGLGANGEGRTEVVATNAYQEGVGLGAEGSNLGDAAQLAERKTKNSYAEYVNTVQDKARERYNNLN